MKIKIQYASPPFSSKTSKTFKDMWLWCITLLPEEEKDQEWIRNGGKTCWFEFSGEEVQFSGQAWLNTTPSLSEKTFAQRSCFDLPRAPDPTVQVFSNLYLISLIFFYYLKCNKSCLIHNNSKIAQ